MTEQFPSKQGVRNPAPNANAVRDCGPADGAATCYCTYGFAGDHDEGCPVTSRQVTREVSGAAGVASVSHSRQQPLAVTEMADAAPRSSHEGYHEDSPAKGCAVNTPEERKP